MFNKWKSFKLSAGELEFLYVHLLKIYHDQNFCLIFFITIVSAPPTADTVEERNEDVEDVMDTNGELFEDD